MQTFSSSSAESTFSTGLGLGIGLGLPSTFNNAPRRSPRCSSVVYDESPLDRDMLFPFAVKSRNASEATIKLDGLVSYWSPMTDDGEGFSGEDEGDDDEEEEEDIHQEDSNGASLSSPLQLFPHACLHMLSPKLESLALAAAQQGPNANAEETVSTALEWAWLVPMLDTTHKQDITVQQRSPAQAPAMTHMPSLESMASSITLADLDEGYNPSIATSSYQSDMARSHSLLSSFSMASFSTNASSVASTSQSVLDRKRPLPSRAASSTAAETQVIKLRSRKYQRPLQGDVRSQSGLTRRDTQMSVVSQKASVHCSSPTADELDCMVFEPMQQLPSPTLYSSELEDSSCTCDSQSEGDVEVTQTSDVTRAVFEIWTIAEEAEKQRKLKKKQPTKSNRPTISDASAMRVQKWVSRVRKSASVGNLKTHASKDEGLKAVEDPLAWADSCSNKSPELKEEQILEPRPTVITEVRGIRQVLEQTKASNVVSKSRQQASVNPIWDFLG